mmetsp:Transcript_4500/g.9750  ORF Transcript_4500/g.9750 Transcript_4500/m.9750 type:complete len:207 (-) Transcript_4500:447-1067(-)
MAIEVMSAAATTTMARGRVGLRAGCPRLWGASGRSRKTCGSPSCGRRHSVRSSRSGLSGPRKAGGSSTCTLRYMPPMLPWPKRSLCSGPASRSLCVLLRQGWGSHRGLRSACSQRSRRWDCRGRTWWPPLQITTRSTLAVGGMAPASIPSPASSLQVSAPRRRSRQRRGGPRQEGSVSHLPTAHWFTRCYVVCSNQTSATWPPASA